MEKVTLKKFLGFIMNPSEILFVLFIVSSCALDRVPVEKKQSDEKVDAFSEKFIWATCEQGSIPVKYERGEMPCTKDTIVISQDEIIKIHFKVTNRNSDDIYAYGYQELTRYRNGEVVERMKLRRESDPYWSTVPFVRIRYLKYLEDLDDDGYLEFAVFPFSPGSAIWGTVRIFSLKNKIEYWGKGRYQFESDTFTQLGCMECSKFNPGGCEKCY